MKLLAPIALACLLPACLSGGSKKPTPHYESSGIRIFQTSQDYMHKKGAYVFGSLRIEGQPTKSVEPRFALVQEYGRDSNQNGLLEANEILDTHRIQDGSLPFTYRIDELTISPGQGRALSNIRIEFAGKEPIRYERREHGAATN